MAIFAGRELTAEQDKAWRGVRDTFDRFAAADRYLFSVPMWNAGVPYILKQFIDVVSQPGLVFGFDAQAGYTGLIQDRKAAVIYTSGVYGEDRGPAFGNDFQAPYFTDWLHWAGIKDVTEVRFRPNLVAADADRGRKQAHERAARIAQAFL
jgi:FMN-dependent NADH-azoreductase